MSLNLKHFQVCRKRARARLVKPFGVILLVLLAFVPSLSVAQETKYFEKLLPLHETKKPPGPRDWLAQHREDGQTFSDFTASQPARPDQTRAFIYLLFLGDFTDEQRKILELASRYIEVYFQMPVKFADPLPLSLIPERAKRVHPQTGDPQVLAPYVIEEVLKPRMPKDAFAYIAFTSSDLWPGENWNFVFGLASMPERIGVWSLYRNGDPKTEFTTVLRRAIQTGTHELGHLFGLAHCIYFECNFNGSNSRQESDSRPLWECPVCLRKLAWSVSWDPVKRYQQLRAISDELGLKPEAEFFEKSLRALQQ